MFEHVEVEAVLLQAGCFTHIQTIQLVKQLHYNFLIRFGWPLDVVRKILREALQRRPQDMSRHHP